MQILHLVFFSTYYSLARPAGQGFPLPFHLIFLFFFKKGGRREEAADFFMKISFDNLDKLTEALEQIDTGMNYIPTDDDIYEYIQPNPEKYAIYLLYISTNRPDAKTKDEKRRLKEIIRIANSTITVSD